MEYSFWPPLDLAQAMPWVRLDDGFAQHPKVVAAGPLAIAMQVAALCYCNKNLTDGFVPRAVARTLLDWQVVRIDGRLYDIGVTCGMSGDDVSCQWVVDILVDAGMWEVVDGGYMVHDYLDFQPSKDQVLSERESAKERMRRVRSVKKEGSAEVRPNNARSSPYPVPVPVPQERIEDSHESPLAGSRQRYSAEFETFWKDYGPTNGPKKPAYTAWERLSKADRAAAIAALPAWLGSVKWQQGYKDYPQKYLNQRFWEADAAAEARSLNGHRPEEWVDRRPAIQPYEPGPPKSLSPEKRAEILRMREEFGR